eukprot:938123-Ditylum_brightwellii.AAC.1
MRIQRKFGIPEATVDVICRMYRDFHLVFSVGKASETIPYTIGAALESLEHFWQTECIPVPQFR